MNPYFEFFVGLFLLYFVLAAFSKVPCGFQYKDGKFDFLFLENDKL